MVMNRKLFCFDLDNTLAPNNGAISKEIIDALRDIQGHGHQVMVISGKPTAYLAGLIRQTGLGNVYISGGNGESFMMSHIYPPLNFLVKHSTEDEIATLKNVKKRILEMFKGKVWLQPNEFQLTVFHYGDKTVSIALERLIKEIVSDKFEVHNHIDCIDVLPNGISKGEMVKVAADFLGVMPEQIVAIGDGENDISMFEVAGMSIGINIGDANSVTKRVSDINEAIKYIQGTLYE